MMAPQAAQMARLGTEGQEILKRLQVLLVQDVIAAALHGVWIGGPLGIDVEHQETVITGLPGRCALRI